MAKVDVPSEGNLSPSVPRYSVRESKSKARTKKLPYFVSVAEAAIAKLEPT